MVMLGPGLLGRGLGPAGKGLCSCAEGQALGLVNSRNPEKAQIFLFSPLPPCHFLKSSCVWEGAG